MRRGDPYMMEERKGRDFRRSDFAEEKGRRAEA